MLNCCIECPVVFVIDEEINCDEDVDLPFICFHYYQNIISCSLPKHILPECGKICPLCMNLGNLRKERLQQGKFLYWNHAAFWNFIHNSTFHKLKIGFFFHMFISLGKIILQVNSITCLWVDTIILTENSHVIMQKDVSYLVKNFAHNNYLVVSPFLLRDFW